MISWKHKIAGGIVAAVIVLIGGMILWINITAAKKFERMERHVKALHEETKNRNTSRPPRPGNAMPGNAWDDYNKALAAVAADTAGLNAVDQWVHRNPKADPEKARERVSAHVPTLDLLRTGVRRKTSDPALQWERGSDMQFPGLANCSKLANLVAARARFLAEEGKPREAADLLLDECQFARDLASNSTLICEMIASAIYSTEFEELRAILVSGSLSKEDLLEVEKALQAAEQSLPKHGQTILNETLFMGYTLLRASGSSDLNLLFGSGPSPLRFWSYGFSSRLASASAFQQTYDLNKQIAQSDDLSWAEVQNMESELENEGRSSKNPLVQLFNAGTQSTGRVLRDLKAQLRLLRTAAIWRATGTCPELDDPFGGKLLHSDKDGVLRVWSVGRDGIDHGGVGTWSAAFGKDTLLEWKRP